MVQYTGLSTFFWPQDEMWEAFHSVNHFKSVVAYKSFVEPANSDLIFARFAYHQGYSEQYFWNASQAIEKYLKAVIVLNRGEVKDLQHNLTMAFDRHEKLLNDVAFTKFDLEKYEIADKNLSRKRENSVRSYLASLSKMGSTDQRYGMASWFERSGDLMLFDQCCFELKRRAVGLNWIVGRDFEVPKHLQPYTGWRFLSVIKQLPRTQLFDSKAESRKIPFEDTDQILKVWNFEYLNGTRIATGGRVPFGSLPSFKNSLPYLICESLKGEVSQQPADFIDCINWWRRCFKLPKDVTSYLKQKLGTPK